MHIDKWRVSFSLLRETVETFVTFGDKENYLQTVKIYEEVAVWHSAGTGIIYPATCFGYSCKCEWIVWKKI